MILDPEDLGCGESCHCRICCNGYELIIADQIGQLCRFLSCTLVAPDDGGTDDLIVLIEHYQSVHLTRKSDAADLRRIDGSFCDHLADSHFGRLPPVARILFRPAVEGCIEGILAGSRRNRSTVQVKQYGLGSAGSYVAAYKVHIVSSLI